MKPMVWCAALVLLIVSCQSVSTRPSQERMPASSEDTSLDTEDQLDIQNED